MKIRPLLLVSWSFVRLPSFSEKIELKIAMRLVPPSLENFHVEYILIAHSFAPNKNKFVIERKKKKKTHKQRSCTLNLTLVPRSLGHGLTAWRVEQMAISHRRDDGGGGGGRKGQ